MIIITHKQLKFQQNISSIIHLHSFIWFQRFLSNTNNFLAYICYPKIVPSNILLPIQSRTDIMTFNRSLQTPQNSKMKSD